MEALLRLPIVSPVHGTKKLCDLHDSIEINIQKSLKALGISNQESFVNLISSSHNGEKLIPSELRLIISHTFGNKETWNFDVKFTEI